MKLTLEEATQQLIPLVKSRRLILLAGAGVSYASKLPLWDDLIERFIKFCREVQEILPENKRFASLLEAADSERKSHPERVASVLKDQLAKVQDTTGAKIQDVFSDWLINELSGEPNENHRLIVSTNYPFILTSNYDTLLESAARSAGFATLALYSYTFNDPAAIAAAIYEERPALIHIHGSMRNVAVGDFVFTSEDYNRIKRQHPGFSMALNTLFIKYSTLFVGYGGSDPHLEDVAEAMAFKLREGWPNLEALPRSFLVLHKDKATEVLDKYKGKLRTDIVALNDYAEMTVLLRSLNKEAPRPNPSGALGGPPG